MPENRLTRSVANFSNSLEGLRYAIELVSRHSDLNCEKIVSRSKSCRSDLQIQITLPPSSAARIGRGFEQRDLARDPANSRTPAAWLTDSIQTFHSWWSEDRISRVLLAAPIADEYHCMSAATHQTYRSVYGSRSRSRNVRRNLHCAEAPGVRPSM